jgi:hypothetical protein
VRGEAIEGLETGLQGLEGLLGGELSPEELENLLQLFGELLQDVEP